MPTTFLNLSLSINSNLPLDELFLDIKDRIEFLFNEEGCAVFSVTYDREQALAAMRAGAANSITPVKEPRPEHSDDVVEVMKAYNLTLPKAKRGEPPFRCVNVIGEVCGLPTLRGKVVLTNGITAFLIIGVGSTHHWAPVHWDTFIPDDLNSLPDDLPIPQPKERKAKKLEKGLEEFADVVA